MGGFFYAQPPAGQQEQRPKSFWREVRVVVVGGLLLAGLLSAWFWVTIAKAAKLTWSGLRVLLRWIWLAVSYRIELPIAVAVAALVIVATAIFVVLKLRRALVQVKETAALNLAAVEQSAREREAARETKPSQEEVVLEQDGATKRAASRALEMNILALLARLDGEPIMPDSIPQMLNVGRLRVDQALASLAAAAVIVRHGAGYGGSPSVQLTETGRNFVIAQNLAPERPRPARGY